MHVWHGVEKDFLSFKSIFIRECIVFANYSSWSIYLYNQTW